MTQETYNGWSNYATWRVKLELWDESPNTDDYPPFEDIYSFSQYIKETTEELIAGNDDMAGQKFTIDYALAFISNVNWYEIAEHIAEDYPQVIKH